MTEIGDATVDAANCIGRDVIDPMARGAARVAQAGVEGIQRYRAADEERLQKLNANKIQLEQQIAQFQEVSQACKNGQDEVETNYVLPFLERYGDDLRPSRSYNYLYSRYDNTSAKRLYQYDKAHIDQYVASMRAGIARLDREAEQLKAEIKIKYEKKLEDIKNGGVSGQVVERLEKVVEKHEESRGKAMVAREYGKAVKETLLSLGTPRNIAYIVAAIIILIAVYKGLSFAQKYFEAKLGRPSLIRESSRAGFKKKLSDFIKSILSGDEDEILEDILNEIILSKELEEAVHILADDARQTHDLGLPYQNVLLYGPPGTGKTEFARILAKYSEMDYAILSGADFSQFKNGEGITELHKLFEWAKNSEKGLLIFIDEADAFLRDRALLDKDGVNLVNAFLSHTGCSSDKFMLVFATNYADELDAAVRSRIHKKFAFGLPAAEERYKIIMLKLKKYIFDDKRVFTQDGEEVEASLSVDSKLDEAYWQDVAKRIDGFSGRDIDQAVGEMRIRAYRSGMNVLTKDIVDFVIKSKIETIENDKRITEYQHKKFEKETGLHRDEAAAGIVLSTQQEAAAAA